MSVKKIRQVLKDFGLSQKETEIYIFLAKHEPLTGGEISKLTKTHRPTVYRILKNLQKKGTVESTLEKILSNLKKQEKRRNLNGKLLNLEYTPEFFKDFY